MFKYRKKPVEIEAFQHFESAGTETTAYPQWLLDAVIGGTIRAVGSTTVIGTLEGDLTVSDGDWIIRGVKGELYPCKPDIFEATYDRVG